MSELDWSQSAEHNSKSVGERKSNANMPFMADLDDMKMLSSPQHWAGSHNRLRL